MSDKIAYHPLRVDYFMAIAERHGVLNPREMATELFDKMGCLILVPETWIKKEEEFRKGSY